MSVRTDETGEWKPIYRRALPVLLDRLQEELGAAGEGLGQPGRWPTQVAPWAEGLGIHALDLERAWVATCADLLGLGYVDFGLDPRDPDLPPDRFTYLRVLADVLEDLEKSLGVTETEAAKRAELPVQEWRADVRGDVAPEESLPRVARGLGLDVGELERRIVARCLQEVGLSSTIRLLKPGPSFVVGGSLLDDGRLLTVDVFRRELWVYDVSGEGRKVESVQQAMHGPTRVERSPGGDLWIFGDGKFLEVTRDLDPRRSYAVWGRRDPAGRLLQEVRQWTLLDDLHAGTVSFEDGEVWVTRVPLSSGGAGRFEIVESLSPLDPLEKRFFVDESPKLAAAGGEMYLLRVRRNQTVVYAVDGGGVVASYPGGTETMEQTARMVGDAFAGLTALGLGSLDDEILVWRRQDHRYWLEDLDGRPRTRPRKSRSGKWAPVVGSRHLGLMEMAGEGLPGRQAAGLLWLDPTSRLASESSDFEAHGVDFPRAADRFPPPASLPSPDLREGEEGE